MIKYGTLSIVAIYISSFGFQGLGNTIVPELNNFGIIAAIISSMCLFADIMTDLLKSKRVYHQEVYNDRRNEKSVYTPRA